MAKVARLFVDEPVDLERGHIQALYRQLGSVGAESVIRRARDELAGRLGQLTALRGSSDHDDIARRARSLIGIAEQIGMTALVRVAGDVCHCAAAGDSAALAATLARLDRVGNRSLTAIWELKDIRR